MPMIGSSRVKDIKTGEPKGSGPVVYWMSRDQRVHDNWAFLYARSQALRRKVPLNVVFTLTPGFLGATWRAYHFMIEGLKEVEAGLKELNVSFGVLTGAPPQELFKYLRRTKASQLVTDFDPLKVKRAWKQELAKKISIPFSEVDARNIVPCWVASPKQEFGAYTIRGKIERLLDRYIEPYPKMASHPYASKTGRKKTDWNAIIKYLKIDRSVAPVDTFKPGEKAAKTCLKRFVRRGLARYHIDRNDPSLSAQSNLSPYLHFGQISSLTIVNAVRKSPAPREAKKAFLEELIVRRELSDNYCYYNDNYDSIKGIPDWARKTLSKHASDRREYSYSLKQLELGKTHDVAWNAAQMEMVKKGKMHGYMRMYWAKKILEWSPSPEDAVKKAIYLNDKYELDGRDPNGYAGILWAIGGLHDRPWGEREIFGMIRYMTFGGLKAKFDIEKYIAEQM